MVSREIRRVPPNWEHPRNPETGRFIPLYDKSYEEESAKWLAGCASWEDGTHTDLVEDPTMKQRFPHYWDFHGGPPDQDVCRPAWKDDEATAYQVYETVSEGTPMSEVFLEEAHIIDWCIEQGYSESAAKRFVEKKWAPSGMIFGGSFFTDIETLSDAAQ